MKLNELFQPGKDNWTWAYLDSDEAHAEFAVGDVPYKFYAYRNSNETGWDVEFAVDKQRLPSENRKDLTAFGITGTGNAATVMAVVTDILRSFIQRYKNSIGELTFTASEPSRQTLYKRMLKRLLPAWTVSEHRHVSGLQIRVAPPDSFNKGAQQ